MYIETCPDCGKDPEVIYSTGTKKKGFLAICSCGNHSKIKSNRINAITAWNKFSIKIKKRRMLTTE